MLLAPLEQSIQLLIRAEQQLLLYHTINLKLGQSFQILMSCKQMKTSSSFTARQPIQISGKDVTSGFYVTGEGVYDIWEQFIAGVHKAGNIF